MSFFKFSSEDIINTEIIAYPRHQVSKSGSFTTGSIFLEKKYLDSSLLQRRYQGYSERLGGFVEKDGPFSASVELVFANDGGTNKELFKSINGLYNYYNSINTDFSSTYQGVQASSFRIVSIPEIYYDREVLTGTFTASDTYAGTTRILYDNGRGGIYSGSLTGTLVGNIFYSEGLVVLKKPDLTSVNSMFGFSGSWQVNFRGTHKIPVKIFRCRAPAGELNCSTNPTYYSNNNSTDSLNRNENAVLMPDNTTYITKVGLYNDDYELVAVASLAHPIRKEESQDLQIRIRWDF